MYTHAFIQNSIHQSIKSVTLNVQFDKLEFKLYQKAKRSLMNFSNSLVIHQIKL